MGKRHFHSKNQTKTIIIKKEPEFKGPEAERINPLPEKKIILGGTVTVPYSHPSLSFFQGTNPVA